MSKRGGGGGGGSAAAAAVLQKDVPWRASPSGGKPIPKIHHSPVLRLSQTPHSNYALSIMKHRNPIGSGLGNEAIVEAAGPDCIVPGQITPIKLLGLKVLGKGSVGTSYKVVLEEGTTVVVKRLKDVVVTKKEFETQMELLGRIKHDIVVPLRSYYYCKDENCLSTITCLLVWPINVDLKFMEPVGRELKSIGKFMDSAVNLMNNSFIDR